MQATPLFFLLLQRLDEQVQPWAEHMGAQTGPTLTQAFRARAADDTEHPMIWLHARPELTRWAAWSEASGRYWSPIEQGYCAFRTENPDAEPYLLLTPRGGFEEVFRKLHALEQSLGDGL